MKTLFISIVCLLIGVTTGFYAGYRYCDRHTTNEAMKAMVESLESSQAILATISARAISLIDSGQDKEAVQMLSVPIGSYYYVYASSTFTNEQRLKLRAIIDGLASTNQIVAAQIAKEISDKKK